MQPETVPARGDQQPDGTQPYGRVGYVLKMYPRFSETFIVNELLAMQQIGVDLEVFSLRLPNDGRFHSTLAQLRAPVTYLRSTGIHAEDVWESLRTARSELPGLPGCLDELLDVEVRDAVQAIELAVAIGEHGITHLHAHFASLATTVARLAARLAGIGYSLTAHAKDIFHDEVDEEELRRKIADAESVVTVSEFNLDYLHRRFGADAENVRRVYNGIDLSAFDFTAPAGRPPVVAAVGRLVEKKGFAHLVDAAALLRRAGRDFRVDLVGAGEQADALRAQVDALGLTGVVRLHGALPQDEVRRMVAQAAVFAAPCVVGADGNRDGLPTVLLEAMALGTPCVATPVTGIPEVIADNRTGLLVDEQDPVALAAALARMLDSETERVRLAAAAREVVESGFDHLRQAEQVARSFQPAMLAQVG